MYDRSACGQVPIVGADFCGEMLARAARKAEHRGAGRRVTFVESDAQALPFADHSFQLVSNAFGLRNVADTGRGLAEMVRVVRPGGRVAILEFSRPRHWLFGRLYRWYFRYFLPLIGQVLSRSPESAYRYLPESVLQFPDYEDLTAMMKSAGLAEVEYHPFTYGIATLYVGVKPLIPSLIPITAEISRSP
jgi:demethylmenaquinone methyltransferase/2-methoxy-6-polyprenyl-1,4-benzoquinol methylase